MALLNVNPTRMELQKLKNKLRVATKGHKLLKDKSDEMTRQFIKLAKENESYRKSVDAKVTEAIKHFVTAQTRLATYEVEGALCGVSKAAEATLTKGTASIMGLIVPKIKVAASQETLAALADTTATSTGKASLAAAIKNLQQNLDDIIKLAQLEKTCDMLATEIEKNRRRINSLEFILIPQIRETMKHIVMKLAENERQNITRLMKVKQRM